MGNAFVAGLKNEAPRGRDITNEDRDAEGSEFSYNYTANLLCLVLTLICNMWYTSVIIKICHKILTFTPRLSRSFKVIGTDPDRLATYDFLLMFRSNYGPISYLISSTSTSRLPTWLPTSPQDILIQEIISGHYC